MKPFEYATPSSLAEATGMLTDRWGETELLAGGTDLTACLKQKLIAPKRVVSLKAIPELRGIRVDADALRIGAMVTLAELEADATTRQHFPAIVEAIRGVGSPQLLAMGTVGGDLCQRPRCWYFRNVFGPHGEGCDPAAIRNGDNRYHAIFGNDGRFLFVSASSLGPALVALGATVKAVGPKDAARDIPAAEFFRNPAGENQRETALGPNEILSEIQIPLLGLKNATYEVRHRQGLDWPYATASVAFRLESGVAADSRVVLGQVASKPWPATGAAAVLNGAAPTEAAGRAGEAAVVGAQPLSKNGYKVAMAKAAVKRAVLAAARS